MVGNKWRRFPAFASPIEQGPGRRGMNASIKRPLVAMVAAAVPVHQIGPGKAALGAISRRLRAGASMTMRRCRTQRDRMPA